MVSQTEAKEMRDEITLLENNEAKQRQIEYDNNIQIALSWWNIIKPIIPKNRNDALANFTMIKLLLNTETDVFRKAVLKMKLNESNEKFKEFKRNG